MEIDCGLLIKNIDNHLAKMANESLANDELTFTQLRFMAYMYDREGKKALLKDMEAFYEVSQPTVTGIMKRLSQKGFVTMEVDEHDHRHKVAALTDAGIDVMEKQENFRKGLQTVILSPLSKEEQNRFIDMLERIWDNLRGTSQEPPEIVLIDKNWR